MQENSDKAKFKVHLEKAIYLEKEGKLTEAIDEYSKNLHANPNCILSLKHLARIYESRNEFDQFIIYIQHVIQLQPDNSLSHARLGRALMAKKNVLGAIASYQKAIALQSEQPVWVYHSLGDAFNQNGQIDEAIAVYKKALEIKPDLSILHAKLAKALMAQKNIKEAIANFKKAIALKPEQPEWVYAGLSDAIYKKVQKQGAIAAYHKAIDMKPDLPSSVYSGSERMLKFQNQADNTITKNKAIPITTNQIKLVPTVKLMRGCGDHAGGFFLPSFVPLYRDDICFVTKKDNKIISCESFFYIINVSNPPWSILRNYCQQKQRKHFVEEIPTLVKNYLKDGMGFLVLDSSNEGPVLHEKIVLELHNIAAELKMSASQIIWLNQNLAMPAYYKQWAENKNIAKVDRVKILFWHFFLVSLIKNIENHYNTIERKRTHISHFLFIKNIREKRYLCLNNTPRHSRVFILLQLIKYKLLHYGLISFNSLKHHEKINFSSTESLYKKTFPNHADLLSKLGELEVMLPMVVDSPINATTNELVTNFDPEPYQKTYFSLVTESGMSSGTVRRFTEKVFKPILNFHPFIVAGEPKTLSLLRDMGFKTFDGFFDESYDDIEDPEKRAMHVIEEVNRLCSIPIEKLHNLYVATLPILAYNAEHLFYYIPTWIRAQMGAEIIYKFRNYAGTFK